MIAFVFPGQGSQYTGMGKELAENFAVSQQVFEEASDALGLDVAKMCFEGSEDELKLTANTQPAILTTSIAALRAVESETGMVPHYAAGHSLGEYAALVCSGALSFQDAVRTVRQRGTFMQEAVPVGVGTMAAIMGLAVEELASVCEQASGPDSICAPANFNSPGQVVIAGHTDAIEKACLLAKENGAKRALPLPVSAPFHCSLMQPAADRLSEVLQSIAFHPMVLPVVSNVEATPNQDSDRAKELLVQQVCAPVKWDTSVQCLMDSGVETFVEVGPGKVLCGLMKRVAKGKTLANVEDVKSLQGLNV